VRLGPCSSVGIQPRTDRQTDRRAWPQYILRRLGLTQNVTKYRALFFSFARGQDKTRCICIRQSAPPVKLDTISLLCSVVSRFFSSSSNCATSIYIGDQRTAFELATHESGNWSNRTVHAIMCVWVRVVVWAYSRGQTDRQTRVTTIHFASSTTHTKCNKISRLVFFIRYSIMCSPWYSCALCSPKVTKSSSVKL